MAKFRKKPVEIEAITFDGLVVHGLNTKGAHIVKGVPWSFEYKGHPITHENDECYIIPTLEGHMKFTPQDMLITGVNGEIYPCKIDIFEKTYEEADESVIATVRTPKVFDFGTAIDLLKNRRRVCRSGWNGKGMWLCLIQPYDYNPSNNQYLVAGLEKLPLIGMKTADNKFVPWLASQTDVLADDWMLVD